MRVDIIQGCANILLMKMHILLQLDINIGDIEIGYKTKMKPVNKMLKINIGCI